MTKKDTAWGAEELIINTDIPTDKEHTNLVVKRSTLETGEMTELEKHRDANVIIYVLEGIVSIRVDEDFYELEKGETHFVESNLPHQIENLEDGISEVLKIVCPFDKDDKVVLEDPYE